MVAPPACEPGQDTPAIFFRLLTVWRWVSRRFWRRVYPVPRVSPLNSQVAFRSQPSGVVFNIAGAWKVFTGPAESRVLPGALAPFVRLSADFAGRLHFIESARVARTVLMRSNNRIPSG